MENDIIKTSNADSPPQGDASTPMQDASGVIPAGETVVENANPLGVTDPITNDGLPSNQTVPLENAPEGSEATETAETPAKVDPSRHEYWQSQHDKVASENLALKQKIEQNQDLRELDAFIRKNPQVLDNIESLSNGNPQGQAPQEGNQVNPLKKPTRPQKPSSYNEVDAFNDPDSESFKFRVAKDQYQDQMLDFYENVEEARAHQMQMQQQQYMVQQQQQSAYTHAQNQWGMDPNEARDFVQWAENPQNITLDSLGRLYRLAKAPSKQQSVVETKVREMDQQKQRLQAPPTTTVQPGKSAPTLSDEDVFNQGLLKKRR